VVAVAATVVLSACQSFSDWRMRNSLERMRADARRDIDEPACIAKGGHVGGFGMFGTPACIVPFPDAGKACTDSAECAGECERYDDLVEAGTRVGGTCQVQTPEDGCFQTIVEGVAQQAICVD
jgi:hypothetical protein